MRVQMLFLWAVWCLIVKICDVKKWMQHFVLLLSAYWSTVFEWFHSACVLAYMCKIRMDNFHPNKRYNEMGFLWWQQRWTRLQIFQARRSLLLLKHAKFLQPPLSLFLSIFLYKLLNIGAYNPNEICRSRSQIHAFGT